MTLQQAVVAAKSRMQKIVTLSVTEAEVISLVMGVQGVLCVAGVLESMELKEEKPMRVFLDNKGVVDLGNG